MCIYRGVVGNGKEIRDFVDSMTHTRDLCICICACVRVCISIYIRMQKYERSVQYMHRCSNAEICQIYVHMQKCIQHMCICRNVKSDTSSISATLTHDLINVYVCVFFSISGICIHVFMCVFFYFISCKQSQGDQRLRLIRDTHTRDLGVCIYMYSRVFKYVCTCKTFTCDHESVSRIR